MINRSYINSHRGHPHYLTDRQIEILTRKVKTKGNLEDLLAVGKALSDPTKLKIFMLLNKVTNIAVSDIAEVVGASQSATSHALADLKEINLIKSSRCGQLICYEVAKPNSTKNIVKLVKMLDWNNA